MKESFVKQAGLLTKNRMSVAACALLTGVLTACGGGSGGGSSATTGFSVAGTSTKGPISDGDVKVYKLSAAGSRTEVACAEAPVKTRGDGTYTCTLPPNETGPFEIEITNGRYCDTEAIVANCGSGQIRNNNLPLGALVVSKNGSLGSVQATPFTAAALAQARIDLANDSTLNFGTRYLASYSNLATSYGINDDPTAAVPVGGRLATFLQEVSLAINVDGLTITDVQNRLRARQDPRTGGTPSTIDTAGGPNEVANDAKTGQQNLNVITDSGTTTGATSSGSTVN